MQYLATLLALPLLALAQNTTAPMYYGSVSAGKTLQVLAGGGGLYYNPNVIMAEAGSKLEFHFLALNHSVVSGAYDTPCEPATNAIYSGYLPAAMGMQNKETFTVTINNTEPLWMYCSQTVASHCQKGMALVVNPPSTGQTLASYQAAAKNVAMSGAPAAPNGGIMGAVASTTAPTATNSTSTSGSSSSSSPMSSSSSSSYGSGSGSGSSSSAAPKATSGANAITVTGWTALGAFVAAFGLL